MIIAQFETSKTTRFHPGDQTNGFTYTKDNYDYQLSKAPQNFADLKLRCCHRLPGSFPLVIIGDFEIGVGDRVLERLFNSSLQASHYHVTYPTHPMSYPLYLKPT